MSSRPSTAWTLANIYLASLGAETLGDGDWRIVGMSEETTCNISLEYFGEQSPFADYIVHEVAHIFHHSKRSTYGLRETRTREFLLNISFGKRETFAYACEAYSRLLQLGRTASERRTRLTELAAGPPPPEERVDYQEYLDILAEAISARNGWKRILRRCAQERPGKQGPSGTPLPAYQY